MGGLWKNEGRVAVDFTALPPAANNNGVVMRCNQLVAGQGYIYFVSDGTYWRPYGGEQKLYVLDAPINMAVNALAQKLISIPIPPGLIVDGRSYIKTVIGADKLLGTTDTLTVSQRIGPLNTDSDPVFVSTTVATTNISAGITSEGGRLSSTTFQKHGAADSGATNPLSSTSATARAAAITTGNFDSSVNYLNVWGQMTTGSTEYGQVHSFTVEIMG